MADVKWIKITTDIFDDEKILLIESLPDSYAIITVWFKLLCLAGKMNNSGVFMMGQIAYTDKMLSTVFRMKETTVTMALQTFEQFGMVEIVDGVITIPNWNKHQSLDAYEKKKERDRLYQAERRANQRALIEKSSDNKTTQSSYVAVSEEDKEGDLEEDIKNNSVPKKRTRFSPPTVDDVKAYCKERSNNVDAERFIDYYNSNGWMVGNNKMKDWKAAVRTWENNGYGNQRKQQPKETKQRSYDIDAFERMMYAEENPSPTAANDPRIREKGEALKQRLAE